MERPPALLTATRARYLSNHCNLQRLRCGYPGRCRSVERRQRLVEAFMGILVGEVSRKAGVCVPWLFSFPRFLSFREDLLAAIHLCVKNDPFVTIRSAKGRLFLLLSLQQLSY